VWDNLATRGARVDIVSHFSLLLSTGDHWTEYFSQQPERQDYFERVMHKYGVRRTAGSTRR
jgi:4-hydroxyacetophenone monooxygenase